MADPLRPDTRPKSRWIKTMPKHSAEPATKAAGDEQKTGGDEIHARLLRMIVENESARKPKAK